MTDSGSLALVRPSSEYIEDIRLYRQEFITYDSSFNGDSRLAEFEDIGEWINFCKLMESQKTVPVPGWVESDQFMLVDTDKHRILGMINFRHRLNDYLKVCGGHIGYSVRPTERRKGYAKIMLALCLEECKNGRYEKVLITCSEDNEASRRTIIACNGVYEKTVTDGERRIEHYWINLE